MRHRVLQADRGAGFALLATALMGSACGESTGQRTAGRMSGQIDVQNFGQDLTAAGAYYGNNLGACAAAERVGPCRFWRSCGDEVDETLDAGTVTVQGVALTNPIYSSSLSGSYYVGLPLLQPGEVVEMAASGSEQVPPHAGSVTVPIPIVLTEPPMNAPVDVDPSSDLVIGWTGGTGDVIDVWLFDGAAVSTRVNVQCSASGDSGGLVIPAAVLEKVPPTLVGLEVSQHNVVTLDKNGWEITLTADHQAAHVDATLR